MHKANTDGCAARSACASRSHREKSMASKHRPTFCGRTRREFLWEAGAGFTGLALTGLLSQDGFFDRTATAGDLSGPSTGKVDAWRNPLAPKEPHFAAKAKA